MESAFKCLSLRQPHAWRVVIGEKKVENRARGTKHRGKLLIHASSSKTDYEQFVQDHEDVCSALHPSWFSFGAIIGCVDLVDVVEMNETLENDPDAYGPYCYLLEHPFWFQQPIPCKGNVILFDVPANLVNKVKEQLAKPPRKLVGIDKVLMELRSTETDVLWDRAGDAFDNGFVKDAVRFLDSLIEKKPADADAFHFRGNVKRELRDYGGALQDYDRAVALCDSNIDILLDRGDFLEEMGFLDEALVVYESAIEKEPGNSEGYYYRACVRIAMKDYDGAIKDFNRSIELDSSDAGKYARRGFLKLMLAQKEEARRDFDRANKLVEAQLSGAEAQGDE